MDSYTYERSVPIVINSPKNSEYGKELGLNTTNIDPFKMSPPNTFMNKLTKRMDTYYSRTVHYSSSPHEIGIMNNYVNVISNK